MAHNEAEPCDVIMALADVLAAEEPTAAGILYAVAASLMEGDEENLADILKTYSQERITAIQRMRRERC